MGNATGWRPNTKWPRGRPRQRWAGRIKEDLSMIGLKNEDKVSRDRKKWRDVVVAVIDLNSL